MAMHSVLVSIIFILTVKKFHFEVLHFVYDTIEVMDDMIKGVVNAIFRTCAFTLIPLIDNLYFPHAEMAVQAVLTIGELLVPVVVLYTGAKVGLNLVEKLAVNPVENFREYLVDLIQAYVEEKSAEHDAVLEKYVVVPIGDSVSETIKNHLLPQIQKNGIEMARIRQYVAALIRENVLAPIQKYGIEMARIRQYVAALIREYVLAPIRQYVLAPIGEYVDARIQRQFRKLRYKRKISKVRAQIENLRKIGEVVVKAVDAAQKKGEVTLPNVPEWLTSANGITDESMDDVERVVNLYVEHFEPTDINREEATSVGAILTNPTFLEILLFFCLVLIRLILVRFLATIDEARSMCIKEYLMESGCYENATRLCSVDLGW